jgi:hypothetical protein
MMKRQHKENQAYQCVLFVKPNNAMCVFPGSVNESTSIFHYDTGLSHADYDHPEFLPFFIDEYPEAEQNRSKIACGGTSASQACVFDFLATGDKALAISSGSEESTSESETSVMGKK